MLAAPMSLPASYSRCLGPSIEKSHPSAVSRVVILFLKPIRHEARKVLGVFCGIHEGCKAYDFLIIFGSRGEGGEVCIRLGTPSIFNMKRQDVLWPAGNDPEKPREFRDDLPQLSHFGDWLREFHRDRPRYWSIPLQRFRMSLPGSASSTRTPSLARPPPKV